MSESGGRHEIIVVDDGSGDDTKAVAESFGDNVRYVRNSVTLGAGAARNRGASCAAGEWILCIDDDDELLPGGLQWIESALSPHRDMILFYVEQHREGQTSIPRVQLVSARTPRSDLLSFRLRPITASQLVVRASKFRSIGGYDESLVTSEDIDIWLRLVLEGARLRVISRPLLRKHEHSGSQLSRNLPVALAGQKAFLRKWAEPMRAILPTSEYKQWYARRLDVIFSLFTGSEGDLVTPLSRRDGLGYLLMWLRLWLRGSGPARSHAWRQAKAVLLRTVLGRPLSSHRIDRRRINRISGVQAWP